mgnify:CR=1 FL=1
MPLSVNSNTSALLALLGTSKAVKEANEAMEKLSTGKRINSAKDDAAGVAISSRLDSSVRGLKQSTRNALDAQALLNTAEGGMQETEAVLQRLRELSVQAANDTNSTSDRKHLDDEAKQLLAEIDRIANSTTWAGQKLLDGSFTNKVFQVGGGSVAADQFPVSIAASGASSLGIAGLNFSLVSGETASEHTTILFSNDSISSPGNIEVIGDGKFVAVTTDNPDSKTSFVIFDSSGNALTDRIEVPNGYENISVTENYIGFHDNNQILKFEKDGTSIGAVTALPTDIQEQVKSFTNSYDINGSYGEDSTEIENELYTFALSGSSNKFTITDKSSQNSMEFETGFGEMSSDISLAIPSNAGGVVFAAFDETQRVIKVRKFDSNGLPTSDIQAIQISDETVGSQLFSMVERPNGNVILFTEDGAKGEDRNIIAGYELDNNSLETLKTWSVDPDPENGNLFPRIELLNDEKITLMWNHYPGAESNVMIKIIDLDQATDIGLASIDKALQTLNSQRASLGAISNRLDHVVANNTNIAINLTASVGRIQDADYAAESARLVKSQLIQQSSVAMIAQANTSKEDVLQLIEGD